MDWLTGVLLLSETYIVGIEACCIGSSCIKQTSFKALVDSGSSFTFLPDESYRNMVDEVLLFCIDLTSMKFSNLSNITLSAIIVWQTSECHTI